MSWMFGNGSWRGGLLLAVAAVVVVDTFEAAGKATVRSSELWRNLLTAISSWQMFISAMSKAVLPWSSVCKKEPGCCAFSDSASSVSSCGCWIKMSNHSFSRRVKTPVLLLIWSFRYCSSASLASHYFLSALSGGIIEAAFCSKLVSCLFGLLAHCHSTPLFVFTVIVKWKQIWN